MERPKRRRDPDPNRIDVNNGEEMRIWAMSMGVTELELRHAVETAGDKADKVRQYLERRR